MKRVEDNLEGCGLSQLFWLDVSFLTALSKIIVSVG
jgi:hypothetical protein